jgi:hypothetical protein
MFVTLKVGRNLDCVGWKEQKETGDNIKAVFFESPT